MAEEVLQIGAGGWVRFISARHGATYFVRFHDWDISDGEAAHGHRLVPRDVWISTNDLTRTNTLRSVPLGRIEAWVNSPEVAPVVRDHLDEPVGKEPGVGIFNALFRFDGRHQFRTGKKAVDLRLPNPATGRDRGDAFYRAVATKYVAAAKVGRGPAAALADANGVQPGTVHRWVKEARRRGFLGAGQRGKAN
jgi:hypothetical protein